MDNLTQDPRELQPFYSYNDIRIISDKLLKDVKPRPDDPNNMFSKGIQALTIALMRQFDDKRIAMAIMTRADAVISIVKAMDMICGVYIVSRNTEKPITEEEKTFLNTYYEKEYKNIRIQYSVDPNYKVSEQEA